MKPIRPINSASKVKVDCLPIEYDSATYNFSNTVVLRWLGQAGFELWYNNMHFLIDAYLSDFLAKKYRGKKFDHVRMMSAPISARDLQNLKYLLCTHRHSDHMDPETIKIALKNNPNCRLVAPKAEIGHVNSLSVDDSQVLYVNAGDTLELASDVSVHVLPAAHEQIKMDASGNHYFLGYVLNIGELKIYHSGDCLPYNGLPQELARRKVDVALLPVNGRDEYRASRSVPGNFTFEEAVQLCRQADIPRMICHHFGMFEFNTVCQSELLNKSNEASKNGMECIVPNLNNIYVLHVKSKSE